MMTAADFQKMAAAAEAAATEASATAADGKPVMTAADFQKMTASASATPAAAADGEPFMTPEYFQKMAAAAASSEGKGEESAKGQKRKHEEVEGDDAMEDGAAIDFSIAPEESKAS